jgi:hypothetical protein
MTKTNNDSAKEFLGQRTGYKTPTGAKANFAFFRLVRPVASKSFVTYCREGCVEKKFSGREV